MRLFDRHRLTRTGWEAFLLALVAWLLSYTWMFADVSVPNERSRVYLTSALVEHGTVAIDTQVARWGKIYDLARRDGSYYSDKAPGSSLLAAVVYKVALLFSEPGDWTIHELINLFRTWLMIPISLGGFLVLRRILEYLGLDPPAVDVTSLAWILGTAAFHYGAAFFGHQIVAVALLGSLYCVMVAEDRELDGRKAVPWWMAGGGALAGVAGMTEYQAIIPCALILAYAMTANEGTRNKGVIPFVAGAAPFAGLLLWYNHAAFGGPFELSYHYLVDEQLREIHGQGIAGVTIPTWEYFVGSMFSLHRGLLSTSPLHLAIVPGMILMWRRGWIRLLVLVGGTLAYFVAFVSSSNMWFAGWGFGPRLLVPAMGLFAIPVGFAVHYALAWPWAEGIVKGLAAAQIVVFQTVVAFFPEPPDSTENPLLDVVPLQWREELVSPNLGQKVLDLEPLASVKLLATFVAGVVLLVVLRGLRDLELRARSVVIILAAATMLGCAAIVHTVGPTWDDASAAKWTKLVRRWDAREDRLKSSSVGVELPEAELLERRPREGDLKRKARKARKLLRDM